MNGELKACPFCSSGRMTVYEDGVWCEQCSAHHDIDPPSRDRAIEAWNTRPTPAPGALPELPELERAVKFLLGEDEIDGLWFGEKPEGKGSFWWRHQLRQAWESRAYAEQCRDGVVDIDKARKCIDIALEHHRKGYDHMNLLFTAQAALQSAFADDEGVKK